MWSTFHTSDQYQWRRANCHWLPTAANARCAIALFWNLQVRAAKVTSEWHDQPGGHPICWMQIGAELTKVRVFRTHLLCNVEQIAHWRWLLRWGIGWSGWSGHLADGIAGFLHLGHEIHSRFQAILAAGTANWSSLGSSFGQGGSTDSITFHWSRRCCGHTLLKPTKCHKARKISWGGSLGHDTFCNANHRTEHQPSIQEGNELLLLTGNVLLLLAGWFRQGVPSKALGSCVVLISYTRTGLGMGWGWGLGMRWMAFRMVGPVTPPS